MNARLPERSLREAEEVAEGPSYTRRAGPRGLPRHSGFARRARRHAGVLGRHRQHRKLERQARATVMKVGAARVASVGLGHLAYDRQAEPRAREPARRAGTVVAIKDVRQVLGVDPGTAIAHLETAVAHSDLDGSARWPPLDGVVDQVRDRSIEPARGGRHEARLGVELEAATRRVQTRPRK